MEITKKQYQNISTTLEVVLGNTLEGRVIASQGYDETLGALCVDVALDDVPIFGIQRFESGTLEPDTYAMEVY